MRGLRISIIVVGLLWSMSPATDLLRNSLALAQAITGAPGAPRQPFNLGASQSQSKTRQLSNLPPPAAAPLPATGTAQPLTPGAALPRLAPAPIVVGAAPMPTPQVFRCS